MVLGYLALYKGEIFPLLHFLKKQAISAGGNLSKLYIWRLA